MRSILKNFFTGPLLTKILLAASLILLAMTVFNHKTVQLKNAQIETMTVEVTGARERVTALEKQIGLLERQIKASDESARSLAEKLKSIDTKKNSYTNKVKELDKNVKTKELLDTKLPDDLKRLLDSAIQTDRSADGEHP